MGNDAWCGDMPEGLTNVSRRAYYASIEFVDDWIGSILGALNATGQFDNTLCVHVCLFWLLMFASASCSRQTTRTCRVTTTTGASPILMKVHLVLRCIACMVMTYAVQDQRMCP